MNEPTESGAIELVRLPPERRRRAPVVAPCMCCCCCCCCCCLHTVGGLAGAAIATSRKTEAALAIPSPGVGSLYWLVVLVLMLLGPFVTIGLGVATETSFDADDVEGTLLVWGFLLVLGLPVVQLAASLVTAIVIAIRRPPDVGLWYGRLGRITLWSFLGTVVGAGSIVALGILLLGALGG